jgi:deoxyribonuclease-4
MNIGLKLFNEDKTFFSKFKGHVDFFEVMAFPRSHYDFLRDQDMPFIVHAPILKHGTNFANPKRKEDSVINIKHAIDVADNIGAAHIIVHPEIQEHDGCSAKSTISILKEIGDKRIIVENMPYMHKGRMLYFSKPEQIKELKKAKIGFCLDIAHAELAAKEIGEDPFQFIKKLNNLNPSHYHMTEEIKSLSDLHLHFKEGSAKLNEIKRLIPEKAFVTLEAEHMQEKILQDMQLNHL